MKTSTDATSFKNSDGADEKGEQGKKDKTVSSGAIFFNESPPQEAREKLHSRYAEGDYSKLAFDLEKAEKFDDLLQYHGEAKGNEFLLQQELDKKDDEITHLQKLLESALRKNTEAEKEHENTKATVEILEARIESVEKKLTDKTALCLEQKVQIQGLETELQALTIQIKSSNQVNEVEECESS